jgi:hypothetical protein
MKTFFRYIVDLFYYFLNKIRTKNNGYYYQKTNIKPIGLKNLKNKNNIGLNNLNI